jgi:multiple sugar transport system substrate-binding protein
LLIEPNKGYYQNFTWYPFLWQGGASAVDLSSKKGIFEGAAVENALKLWGDLVKAGAPSKISIPGTWDTSLLGGGQAAMQICGTWAVAGLEKDYAKTNIGLVPLPVPDGGKAATDAGGWKMMVSSKGKYTDEAAKFAMWAFAEDVNLPLKWCTDVKFAYSPRKSVVDAGKDIYTKGLRKVFTEEIYSSANGEPRYPSEVVNAIGDALQEVMFKNGDPKEAAKKANDKINEFLKTFEGAM